MVLLLTLFTPENSSAVFSSGQRFILIERNGIRSGPWTYLGSHDPTEQRERHQSPAQRPQRAPGGGEVPLENTGGERGEGETDGGAAGTLKPPLKPTAAGLHCSELQRRLVTRKQQKTDLEPQRNRPGASKEQTWSLKGTDLEPH